MSRPPAIAGNAPVRLPPLACVAGVPDVNTPPCASLSPRPPHVRFAPTMPFSLARLRDGVKPFRLHFFTTLRSTNDHAAALRRRNLLFAPAIVLTPRQTAGRGRAGNTWFSNADVLTVTFAMPVEENLAAHQLPLVAGLAVRNAAAELTGSDAIKLKWPNDLVFPTGDAKLPFRKLAGLLCERTDHLDLIGLGLNVNLDPADAPGPLRHRITSLSTIAGQPLDPTDVLIAVARHLHRTLSRRTQHPFGALLSEYDEHHALPGHRVRILNPPDAPIAGVCEGLDAGGRLLVRSGRTLNPIISGHVELA